MTSSSNILLCVSGGLDSISLLHCFRHEKNILVAHFNHGTRPSADSDERFVQHLATDIYHFPFFSHKRFLGENTSENLARLSRYDFLKSLAHTHNATIYTAHHADDLLESIAINLLRGTSYHGLLPFGDHSIKRPFLALELLPKSSANELLELQLPSTQTPQNLAPKSQNPTHELLLRSSTDNLITKSTLLRYTARHHLTFREDPTNCEDKYLRNRLRAKLQFLSPQKKHELLMLYKNTLDLNQEINSLIPKTKTFSRNLFRTLPDSVALEILRKNLLSVKISLTRPQLKNFLAAIRTYPPEKSFNLPKGKLLKLHKSTFVLPKYK